MPRLAPLVTALLLCTLTRALWAADGPCLPLRAGAEWTYARDVQDRTRTQVPRSPSVTIRVTGGVSNGHWPLVVDGIETKAKLSADGVQLLQLSRVGVAGAPALIPVADLRWSGPDRWKTQSFAGCLGFNIMGRREGPEKIETPAGTFECLKITNEGLGQETWWLAPGVGIVKHTRNHSGVFETWTLLRRS